ncbi:rab family small GTPase [Naegleria gruberi]|uniref:Rab family small GTPase n=1 Tax=Naegleria gruberi TaxID=5762 RepID=D2VN08_NAEGR|nr:rab family small GTPase [Naegleria gruberi]EFC41836.1 rab family small GTPase [Naegleria gruberi]|eukprot:XP_002674580.1 rab family small GTPase [Naegleria gruberi strain NEG-M]
MILLKEEWVDEELKILKGYFRQYFDLQELKTETISRGSNSFIGNTFSFIGSFFSSKSKSTNSLSNSTVSHKDENYLTKILLDGESGSGKTSLLNCVFYNSPVVPNAYVPCMGEMPIKNYQFGNTARVKIQIWDLPGNTRFRSISTSYHRGATFFLLFVDPYSIDYNSSLKEKLEYMKSYLPGKEVIFITTKKDRTNEKRYFSNEQADQFAFENFGGIHLDITNTQLDEPKTIVLYCALLKYLLSP